MEAGFTSFIRKSSFLDGSNVLQPFFDTTLNILMGKLFHPKAVVQLHRVQRHKKKRLPVKSSIRK